MSQALSVLPVMLKRVSTSLSAFVVLASKIWAFVVYVFKKQTRAVRKKRQRPNSHESHDQIKSTILLADFSDNFIFRGPFHLASHLPCVCILFW